MIYNRNNFSIHALCDKDRDYLGVHVTPEFTEVTNGRYLLRVSTPEVGKEDLPEAPGHPRKELKEEERETIGSFTIHKDAAKAVENMIPKEKYPIILDNTWLGMNTNEEQAEFISTDLEVANSKIIRKIDGRWPKTDSVFPSGEIESTLGFDPDLMLKLCQQLKKMEVKYIKMDIRGENSPIELTGDINETSQKVKALLMPKKQ